jgi:hypothetical protein
MGSLTDVCSRIQLGVFKRLPEHVEQVNQELFLHFRGQYNELDTHTQGLGEAKIQATGGFQPKVT